MLGLTAAGLGRFTGGVIRPGDAAFDLSRRVWNGAVDRTPAAIVRCHTSAEVAAAIITARQYGFEIAVRSGGHSLPGFSTCDGGLVIDLSPMRRVNVDANKRRAVVEGGTKWAHFDAATSLLGLAAVGGLVSTTGVAGLTLGGGIGWLSRLHGLACDNLLSAELVTGDGLIISASAEERPELFWALRGGGGNFGVVTRFEFRLHEVRDMPFAICFYSWERATAVLRAYREMADVASDDFATLVVLGSGVAGLVPESFVGKPVLALAGHHNAGADPAFAQLRDLGPISEQFERVPYVRLQTLFDTQFPAGDRYHFRGTFASDLSDAMIETLVEHAGRKPSAMCALHLHHLGGAVARVDPASTAFPDRGSRFAVNVIAHWTRPEDDEPHRDWARAAAAGLEPFGNRRGYVNFQTDLESALATYGNDRFQQLLDVKRQYDADNVFHLNQNINPDGGRTC